MKQESYFWWRNDYPKNPKKYENRWYLIPDTEYPITGIHKGVSYGGEDHLLAAFTVAELGEMLPKFFTVSWQRTGEDGEGMIQIEDQETGKKYHSLREPSQADGCATMLIYLLENKLITL